MTQWRVEMLGGLRVVGDEHLITQFGARKTTALLALLALRPERVQPREELAAQLWPDAEWESSRNRLKQALSMLRKHLGPIFEASHFGIKLSLGSVETDVAQWEGLVKAGRLREAGALWQGELLPGYYEDALVQERERLNALKSGACPDDAPWQEQQVRLPNPLTRFVGREQELATLTELLSQERWVTITGPGGMGKTRLAIQAARQQKLNDLYFVPLVERQETGQLPAAIAAAVNLPLSASHLPLEALCSFLKGRPTLLVLDNAEHLELAELARLCQTLLERLPLLRLLVTSRRVLGGQGEFRFALPTLPIRESAMPLFLDRARRIHPEFSNTPELERLCALLEGVPLAIELCAAWAGALSAPQMLARLEQHDTRLLTGRGPTLPERHRSVEAAFLGSYAQLTTPQQELLRGLTVFQGGWTLEAAEVVCPTDDTLGDLLALTEASLVQNLGERFTLLESLRQVVAGLLSAEERAERERVHYRWCRAWSERRGGESEGSWLERCDAELGNFRSALERDHQGELLVGLQLFLNLRGYNAEATGWLEQALERSTLPHTARVELLCHLGATQLEQRNQLEAEKNLTVALELAEAAEHAGLQALALYHLGRFAELQRLPELAQVRHEKALALRRVLNEKAGIARSCNMLAQLAIQRGALDLAGPLLAEADACARMSGRESILADILYQRAHLTMMSGDAPGALVLLEECQEQARALGLRLLLARVTHSLGCTAQELGDEVRARSAFLEAARLFHTLRAKLGTHFPLWYLARLYSALEEWDIVLLTMGSAMTLWEDLARPLAPEDKTLLTELRARADEALGAQRAEHLWQQGRTLAVEEILTRVEARPPQKHPRPALASLA